MKKFIFRVHVLFGLMIFPAVRLIDLFVSLARFGWGGLQSGFSSWWHDSSIFSMWSFGFKLFKNGRWPDDPSTLERWANKGAYDDQD